MSKKVDLNSYNNSWYKPGNKLKIMAWYWVNELLLKSTLLPFSKLRLVVLRCFGAKIGFGVTIKPGVNVKYPWLLKVGNHCWIGEDVWIDNLAQVSMGDNVCISQGAMLLCGNHDFKVSTFDRSIDVPINRCKHQSVDDTAKNDIATMAAPKKHSKKQREKLKWSKTI